MTMNFKCIIIWKLISYEDISVYDNRYNYIGANITTYKEKSKSQAEKYVSADFLRARIS